MAASGIEREAETERQKTKTPFFHLFYLFFQKGKRTRNEEKIKASFV